MSVTMTINETVNTLGFSFPANITITADGGQIKSVTMAAAKAGTLTTRSSDSAGTLTMASGHGITTGDRLDLYWSGGSRRGITVGTVSGTSVPLTTSTGSGDVLPAQDTAITAQVPQEETFALTGNDVTALSYYSQRKGIIVLAESDDTEADAAVLTAGVSSTWTTDRDATVPTSGNTVTKAYFSHADSSNTCEMRVAALFS